ncbi:cell division protein FtsH [Gemmiger sp. An120]|uniref:ATP-dependent zinc metalloprotease FtsH n=1 Tax=Gemmiger TaxID=204475 RepID=UPI000B3A2603|nr:MULTISPECIES: ATP-dependent zinc metalloprotease FtsH [Gemmiger]MBM6914283.1 ATP-dependent metallopeptidase FtsH/Yme1/Tma family protein [Gemmiger formicilis]OUQ44437.1 cell division protein FtsH [Gemmiger sp. An120]
MQEIKDTDAKPTPPKKPLIFYYIIAMIVVMLLNALLFPSVLERQVTEVPYNEFLDMVDEGQVTEVALSEADEQLVFIAGEDENSLRIYKTGIWPDDGQRLLQQLRSDPNIDFSAEIPTQANPLLSFIVSWVFPIFFFLIIGELLSRFMMKRMNKQMGGGFGNAMTFGKSGAKIYVEESATGVTFADVAGQEEAKESLKEVVDFLHEPGKYADIGARLPKGVLLVGPPGTGKTLLAKAVAGEAHVPFFSISGSEFVEMFVGMGAAKVRDLFKQANEKAPCIVFIDEIDAIGKKRDTGGLGGNDEREQTLNQLLAEMDGFDSGKGVVLLAATNRPESLDPALLRPGRFDRRVPVELPDLNGRKAIFRVHARKVHIQEPVDWDMLARATAGASGAELANIVNEAALRAVRLGRQQVTQADLEESVETVIAGAQRKNAMISAEEKKIVAYHEIGHALVAALQSHSAPVTKITIIPRTSGALGYTMQVDEGNKSLMSRAEILARIATLTGGRSAEELIFGKDNMTTGASNDIEQATKLARAMITRYGMTDEFDMMALETVQNQYLGGDASLTCGAQTAARIDEMVSQTIRQAHEKAYNLLKDHEDQLRRLSDYLLERETITGEEFMKLLQA